MKKRKHPKTDTSESLLVARKWTPIGNKWVSPHMGSLMSTEDALKLEAQLDRWKQIGG
jgi:hypothetical protein